MKLGITQIIPETKNTDYMERKFESEKEPRVFSFLLGGGTTARDMAGLQSSREITQVDDINGVQPKFSYGQPLIEQKEKKHDVNTHAEQTVVETNGQISATQKETLREKGCNETDRQLNGFNSVEATTSFPTNFSNLLRTSRENSKSAYVHNRRGKITDIQFPGINDVGTVQTFLRLPKLNQIPKLLFTRELGIHAVPEYTASVFNRMMERKVLRSMVESRGKTLQNTDGEILVPLTYELPLMGMHCVSPNTSEDDEDNSIHSNSPNLMGHTNVTEENGYKDGREWIRIKVMTPSTIQMGVVDSYLWSSVKKTNPNYPQHDYFEQIYKMPSIWKNLELIPVTSRRARGKMIKAELLQYPSEYPLKPNKFLITLNDANQLQALDITNENDIKTTNNIQLQRRIHQPRVGRFTDFAFIGGSNIEQDIRKGKLLVFGNDSLSNLQVILMFTFPPFWENISIIHLDNSLQIEFSLRNEKCFMLKDDDSLIVACWLDVLDKAVPIPNTKRSHESVLPILQEYKLDELPQSNNNEFNLLDRELLVLDTNPQMFCNFTDHGIQFFKVNTNDITQMASQPVYHLWAIKGLLGDFNSKVMSFGDGSARVLVTNYNIAQHVVIDLDQTNSITTGTATGNLQWPFNKSLYDPNECVIESLPTYCPLATDYCPEIGLFAVLFGRDHAFMVKLYDLSDYKLVKALPLIQLCTPRAITAKNLKDVKLIFRPQFICIEFAFNAHSLLNGQVRQVYICRLMND